jgi:hypothetical protein
MALSDNLIAYWKLDESSGTLYDSTAKNNNKEQLQEFLK